MLTPTFRRVRKRLRRLSSMNPAEVLDRVRQETSKHVDSALASCGYRYREDTGEVRSPAMGAFFFEEESVEPLLRLLHSRLPERRKQIVDEALRICAHHFGLLGYPEVDYGPVIDWHRDGVHGKTAPIVPFHRVPYFDFGAVGDPKIIWELNRHQHFVTLAKAYRLTGEERFCDEIDAQWASWKNANPYPIGINWASSLEVAFRALSWLWTYWLLSGTAAAQHRFCSEVLDALALAARHIERYLSTHTAPNTHLLGEGVGLFFIGTLCPGLKRAQRWKSIGWSIIEREAQRQVRDDGMHFEQSTYYHVYALDFLLHAVILARRNGMTVPAALDGTLLKMLEVLSRLAQNGVPKFGDDDGGRVFDGRRNRGEHLADPLAVGAILFARGDFKSVAGALREETLWLLGHEGAAAWDNLAPAPPDRESFSLRDSGVYFMSGVNTSHDVVIEAGPALMTLPSHWHADALSMCVRANGKALLIDPGTNVYTDTAGTRSAFRGTSAHNTLQIDGRDQADMDGPFRWASLPNVDVERWITGEHFDLFSGSHDGYERIQPGLIHRRTVFSLRSEFVFVQDAVAGSGEHRVAQYWHVGPHLLPTGEKSTQFVADDGCGLALVPLAERAWTCKIDDGCWSPVYGTTEPARVVRLQAQLPLPGDFAVAVVPTDGTSTDAGVLTRVEPHPAPWVRAYRYRAGSAEHLLFFSDRRERWFGARCASDAEFLCATSVEGKLCRLILCNGSFAEIGGREYFRRERSVASYEVRF